MAATISVRAIHPISTISSCSAAGRLRWKLKLTADFSNTLTKSQIEEMATVDEFEVVKEVQVS